MTRRTLTLTDQLYEYYLSVSLREVPLLADLRHETAKLSSAKMQIAPEEGQFLAFLVELIGAKKTIDIGVYTGYSSLVVAMALPPDGKVIGCDINNEWTKIARKYWSLGAVSNKIELHIAPALNTLQKLIAQGEAQSFDFVFIDADKKNYELYYEHALVLLRSGGLIAVDNVLWGGGVVDAEVQDENTVKIRAFNQKLFVDDRISLSMIPIADGLTLVRKR